MGDFCVDTLPALAVVLVTAGIGMVVRERLAFDAVDVHFGALAFGEMLQTRPKAMNGIVKNRQIVDFPSHVSTRNHGIGFLSGLPVLPSQQRAGRIRKIRFPTWKHTE